MPKVEDKNIETVDGQEVTVISVATVDRDGDGAIVKNEDGTTPKDDCFCGCGNEPTGKRARYLPGHDQRALGFLARAQKAGRRVIFTPHSEKETLTPRQAADHMFHEKMVAKAEETLTREPTPAKSETPGDDGEE